MSTEFETLRRALFLSTGDLVDLLGVGRDNIAAWSRGRKEVPAARMAWLRQWDDVAHDTAITMAQRIQSLIDAQLSEHMQPALTADDAVRLLVYRRQSDFQTYAPDEAAQWPHCHIHWAMVWRVAERLKPLPVRLVGFRGDHYADWLGDRDNTSAMRAQWASLQ